MASLTFDTYRIAQKLQAKGYTKEQAEGFIEVVQEINLDEIATKADIAALKSDVEGIRSEMHTMGIEIKYEILKWVLPLILGLYGLIIFKMH